MRKKKRQKSTVLEKLLASITEEQSLAMRNRLFDAIKIERIRLEKALSIDEIAHLFSVDNLTMTEFLGGNIDTPATIKDFLNNIYD